MKIYNKIILYIGDDSGDGHGNYEFFVYDSNYPVEDIREAYKKSCAKVGVQFNHNVNYITNTYPRFNNPYYICTEYENNTISKEAQELLLKVGLDAHEYSYEKNEISLDVEGFTRLLLDFIKLSLKDLELTEASFKKSELKSLTVINSGDLNHQFGYGVTGD